MNEPSLRCRCGGEYERTEGRRTGTTGGHYPIVAFCCDGCNRKLSGPLDLEADLRYELQQMNLKLPDGWIDNQGTAWFATTDLHNRFGCCFVSVGKESIWICEKKFDSRRDATRYIGTHQDGCAPINRSQVEPDPTFRAVEEMPKCPDCGSKLRGTTCGDYWCSDCVRHWNEEDLPDAVDNDELHRPEINDAFFKTEARGW